MWNSKYTDKVFNLLRGTSSCRAAFFYDLFIYRVKIPKKLLTAKSHDSGVPIPVQCNIINLRGLHYGITIFVILGCIKMKVLEKTARFEVSSSKTMQTTETAAQSCSK